jgi:steroid delta-isomerase-like uncharacterized protein
MPTEHSKDEQIAQLVTALVDAWNTHDIERVAEFYAQDYEGVDVGQAMPQHGPGGIRQMLAWYWGAFPDLHFTADETIVQGQRVALVWTARGSHQGRLMNIPPTGRRVEVRGVSLLTMNSNKVTRARYIWDVAGLLRSIGLLPEL